MLQIVGLENTRNKKVRDFSLGMIQRLKLAQALLENPDILILDEPINGLDPDGISDLRNLIIKLNKEHDMTIIISSHILSELENTVTTFGILSDGKIAFQSSKRSAELSFLIKSSSWARDHRQSFAFHNNKGTNHSMAGKAFTSRSGIFRNKREVKIQ